MDEKAHFCYRQNTNSNEVQICWQTHFFTLENSSWGKKATVFGMNDMLESIDVAIDIIAFLLQQKYKK